MRHRICCVGFLIILSAIASQFVFAWPGGGGPPVDDWSIDDPLDDTTFDIHSGVACEGHGVMTCQFILRVENPSGGVLNSTMGQVPENSNLWAETVPAPSGGFAAGEAFVKLRGGGENLDSARIVFADL